MPQVSNEVLVVLVLVVLALIAAGAWWYYSRQRTQRLQERFGPEYDRTLQQVGERRPAEAVLEAREERAKKLDLRALSREDRDRYVQSWRSIEGRFVDDPRGALGAADRLFTDLMVARGYPDADHDQRVSDLSATYPHLVGDYRQLHEFQLHSRQGEPETEDLRRALVAYRSLFEGLLETRETERREAERREAA